MEQADIRELEQGHEREGHTSQHSEYAHNPCQGQVLHLITGIQEQHGGHHQVDGSNDDEGNKNINQMWINVRCYNIEDVPVQIWIFVGVAIVLVIYITIRIRMSHYREKK